MVPEVIKASQVLQNSMPKDPSPITVVQIGRTRYIIKWFDAMNDYIL